MRFYSACTQPGSLAIITELMPASLSDLLYGKHKAQLPADKWHDRRKFQLLSDIISGVAFLHGKNVSHRDLKSMNVLCDKDFRAKLCDFGASSFRARASVRFETRVGTQDYDPVLNQRRRGGTWREMTSLQRSTNGVGTTRWLHSDHIILPRSSREGDGHFRSWAVDG